MRILVVDDEPRILAFVARRLEAEGFAVHGAADGISALQAVRRSRYDLVVLDLLLPDSDGHLVLQRLRELPAPPPIVVVSAQADYGNFARALREGAEAYLVKPFRVKDLLTTCEGILMGTRPSDRRRQPRQTLAGEVQVRGLDGEPLTLGELVDLSPGGAQAQLGTPLQPRAGVRLAVRSSAGDLDVEGRVAWLGLASKGFAHGFGFVNLSPEHEDRLRALLEPSA